MIFRHHFQNAYVTRSREATMELLRRKYGIDDFVQFEVDMDMQTPEGPKRLVSRAALGWVGNFNVEIIEPAGGELDVYSDFLPGDDSPRFHHVCMRTANWDATLAAIAVCGWQVAFEGHMDGLRFAYVDVRAELGHYLEYLWAEPAMWQMMGGPADFPAA